MRSPQIRHAAHKSLAPGEAAPPGGEPVRVNNRVRVALRGALGRLQLVSPDPAERLAAAEAVFRSRDAANVPLLESALAREAVPRIRGTRKEVPTYQKASKGKPNLPSTANNAYSLLIDYGVIRIFF